MASGADDRVWLRWLLVLPAAVSAFFAIQLVMAVVTWFEPDRWSQFINSIAGPFCFVYAGAKVAPKNSVAVAVVLTVICAVFYAVVVTLGLIARVADSEVWVILTSTVAIAAAIVACLQIHHEATRSRNA